MLYSVYDGSTLADIWQGGAKSAKEALDRAAQSRGYLDHASAKAHFKSNAAAWEAYTDYRAFYVLHGLLDTGEQWQKPLGWFMSNCEAAQAIQRFTAEDREAFERLTDFHFVEVG